MIKARPTISELESILRGDSGPQEIEILPDGSIHTVPEGKRNDAEYPSPITAKYAAAEFYGIFLLIGFCLSSCSPYIIATHDKVVVSTGTASKVEGFSGKAKTADGTSIVWSVVNSDSTEVPKAIASAYTIAKVSDNTFKSLDSNNAAQTTQQKNALDAANTAKRIDAKSAAKESTDALKEKVLTLKGG